MIGERRVQRGRVDRPPRPGWKRGQFSSRRVQASAAPFKVCDVAVGHRCRSALRTHRAAKCPVGAGGADKQIGRFGLVAIVGWTACISPSAFMGLNSQHSSNTNVSDCRPCMAFSLRTVGTRLLSCEGSRKSSMPYPRRSRKPSRPMVAASRSSHDCQACRASFRVCAE